MNGLGMRLVELSLGWFLVLGWCFEVLGGWRLLLFLEWALLCDLGWDIDDHFVEVGVSMR